MGQLHLRISAFFVVIISALVFGNINSRAASWPPAQIDIVIPHSLGGGQDVITRALGDSWGKKLGTSFIYEIRPGAAGRIGYDQFLKEAVRGNTVVLSSNIATAAIMYAQQKPSWKWQQSLYPVGMISVDPGVLFVRGDSKYKTLKDLVKDASHRKLRIALANWASADNMLIQQIAKTTNAQFQVIPVIKAVRIISDVMAGDVEMGFTKLSTLRRVGGNLRYLAVTLPKNTAPMLTQHAPTVDESLGIKTIPVASYRTVLVSKKFKDEHPKRFARIEQTFLATKKDPDFIKRAKKLGVPEELMANFSVEEINDILQRYWKAYAQYGQLFKVKR